jgi:hypothetical protein
VNGVPRQAPIGGSPTFATDFEAPIVRHGAVPRATAAPSSLRPWAMPEIRGAGHRHRIHGRRPAIGGHRALSFEDPLRKTLESEQFYRCWTFAEAYFKAYQHLPPDRAFRRVGSCKAPMTANTNSTTGHTFIASPHYGSFPALPGLAYFRRDTPAPVYFRSSITSAGYFPILDITMKIQSLTYVNA